MANTNRPNRATTGRKSTPAAKATRPAATPTAGTETPTAAEAAKTDPLTTNVTSTREAPEPIRQVVANPPPRVQPVPDTDRMREAERVVPERSTDPVLPVAAEQVRQTEKYATAEMGDGVTVRVAKSDGAADGLNQVASTADPRPVKRCTVGEGDNRCSQNTTPGDEICSYHAVWFYRDGTRRRTGPVARPGAVDIESGPGVVRSDG